MIGRGGMGVVYLGQHVQMKGRKAAVKVLSDELADDPEFQQRFIRESDLAGSLEHPNIVPVYDAGRAADVLYCAMRYVRGTDLKAVLKAEGPLSLERTLTTLGDVALALDFAHGHGLVHRDVKPGNVLIEAPDAAVARDRVFLSDFGLVKQVRGDTKLTRAGSFVGTLNYAAPEVFRGEDVDGRADVYSLGCMLYECLVGATPFVGPTDASVMYAHLNETPAPLATVRTGLPAGLDDVIAMALAKD